MISRNYVAIFWPLDRNSNQLLNIWDHSRRVVTRLGTEYLNKRLKCNVLSMAADQKKKSNTLCICTNRRATVEKSVI